MPAIQQLGASTFHPLGHNLPPHRSPGRSPDAFPPNEVNTSERECGMGLPPRATGTPAAARGEAEGAAAGPALPANGGRPRSQAAIAKGGGVIPCQRAKGPTQSRAPSSGFPVRRVSRRTAATLSRMPLRMPACSRSTATTARPRGMMPAAPRAAPGGAPCQRSPSARATGLEAGRLTTLKCNRRRIQTEPGHHWGQLTRRWLLIVVQ